MGGATWDRKFGRGNDGVIVYSNKAWHDLAIASERNNRGGGGAPYSSSMVGGRELSALGGEVGTSCTR